MLILDESLHLKYSDVHNVFCAKSLYNAPCQGDAVFLGESKSTLFGLPKVDAFTNH